MVFKAWAVSSSAAMMDKAGTTSWKKSFSVAGHLHTAAEPTAPVFAGHTLTKGSIFGLVQKLISKRHSGLWLVAYALPKGSLRCSSCFN